MVVLVEKTPDMVGRLDTVSDAVQSQEAGTGPQIAVCGIADGQQAGHDVVLAGVSTGTKDCQPVCGRVAAILGRDLLVTQFRAQAAHVAQATRPNQGFTAFRRLVVFTG